MTRRTDAPQRLRRPLAWAAGILVGAGIGVGAATSLPINAAADSTAILITQPLTLASITCPASGSPLFCYQPESATIAPGGEVTWTNQTLLTHTATVDGVFTTGDILPGQSVTLTIAPGTYTYHCTHHQEAAVLVVPTPPPAPTATPAAPDAPGQISGPGAAKPTVVQGPPLRTIIVPGPRGSTDLPPIDASPRSDTELPPITSSEPAAPVVVEPAAPVAAQTDRPAGFYAIGALVIIGGVSVLLGAVFSVLALVRLFSRRRFGH